MEDPSSDVFSALVGRIYDCVLAPGEWPSVAADLRRHLPQWSQADMEGRLLQALYTIGNRDGIAHATPRSTVDASLQDMLLDHLGRAAALAKSAGARRADADLFEAMMDSFETGVLLVDRALYVLRTNRSAEAMLDAGAVMRLRRGYVELASLAAQQALRETVRNFGWRNTADAGASIAAADAEDAPALIRVMPFRRSDATLPIRDAPIAIMLISRATAPVVPHAALASLYGLTPAETRVLKHIAEGAALSDVAARLGLKTSTVKTHLLHIFDKTATKRQADLVRLANSVSLPM
jgi:DNA-binding CsgD family transcriptional regulator/PAS domain-containing protein